MAGRFSFSGIPPAAPPILGSPQFPWTDFQSHLNRDQFYSPFVSTSNHFIWTLRLALKMAESGKVGYISLIDPMKLDREAVYHAQPYHRSLCKKFCFTRGAHFYHGLHEFMIWAKISRSAVITTIEVKTLLDLAKRDNAIGAVLRLDMLAAARSAYAKTTLPALKRQGIKLTSETITAIAKVCSVLHLDGSHIEALGSVVSDMIQGLGLQLEHKPPEEWAKAATVFAEAIAARSVGAISLKDHQNMRWAFLNACVWATGHFNSRQKPDKMAIMLRRAIKIGLDSPAEILTKELDAAKLSILAHAKREQRVLQGFASRALLAEPDEVEDEIMADADEGHVQAECNSEDEDYLEAGYHSDNDDSDGSVYEL